MLADGIALEGMRYRMSLKPLVGDSFASFWAGHDLYDLAKQGGALGEESLYMLTTLNPFEEPKNVPETQQSGI